MIEVPDFGPVVLKFGASWCTSCKQLSKTIENKEYEIPILEIDVDKNVDMAKVYNIRSLPTMVLLVDGQEVKKTVGFNPKTLDEFFVI